MPTTVQSTNLFTAATAFTLTNAANGYYILGGVTVFADAAIAIASTATQAVTLTVDGTLMGTRNLLASSGGACTLSVGSGGTLRGTAFTGESIVTLGAGGNTVFNAGEIVALGGRGVALSGGGNWVENHGLISALETALLLGPAGGTGDTILNFGTLTAKVALDASGLASGPGLFLANSGLLRGTQFAVLGSAVSDTITNDGTISGATDAGLGNDTLANRGRMLGDVQLGGGDDAFDGRGGFVSGLIDGGSGNDRITACHNDDAMTGNSGNDTLRGLGGDDEIAGDSGNDTLFGNAGRDVLRGGVGRDVLTGGGDADIFVFATAAEAGSGNQRDTITDFQSALDKLDLSGIMAGQSYIAGGIFANVAGQIRYDQALGQLQGDTDGNGQADYTIQLGLNTLLASGDLIL